MKKLYVSVGDDTFDILDSMVNNLESENLYNVSKSFVVDNALRYFYETDSYKKLYVRNIRHDVFAKS